MESSKKREIFMELLKNLSMKKDWHDITTVRAMFKPDRTEEMLYTLQTEPEISEIEFSLRFLAKRK